MKPFRVLLSTLAAAFLFVGALAVPAQAADERTLFDGLHGQPPQWMQSIRDTLGKVYLTVSVFDIATASNADTPLGGRIFSPVRGNITRIYTVLTASIAADLGTSAESNIVPAIGGVEILGGTVTIASTSFNGTSDSATPTSLNAVTVGSIISFESDGLNATPYGLWIVIEIDRDDV